MAVRQFGRPLGVTIGVQGLVAAWLMAMASAVAAQQGEGQPQVTAVQPAVVINYRERPRMPFDPQRLKLRPVIDGDIGATEWTPLYTVSEGPVTGTVYMNWDDDNVYLAARTNQVGWMVVDLDAAGDGWLRGADNLEIAVAPLGASGTPPLTARLLDAVANRDVPVWNTSVVSPQQIQCVVRQNGGGQSVEMAIPRGVAGVTPREGAQMGVRVDFLPTGTVPAATAPYEPHLLLDVTLVESRSTGVTGVVPRLSLEDSELVPGQVLHATLDLVNQVDTRRTVRSVTWTGVGPAQNYVKLLREVNIPPILGLKTLRLRYATPLPEATVPGFYQLTVSAVLDDGSEVSATASFSVVEAFTIQLDADPLDIALIGPTNVKVTVIVSSAAPGFKKAEVTLSPPASWELKGKPRRSVNVHRENGVGRVTYGLTIPSVTQTGEYRISAEVTWRGRSWTAHRTIKVTRVEQSRPAP